MTDDIELRADEDEKEEERIFFEGRQFGYKQGWNDAITKAIKGMDREYDAIRVVSFLASLYKNPLQEA